MHLDDPSRETSSIIDEYLYHDEFERFEDELKFNVAKSAVLYKYLVN